MTCLYGCFVNDQKAIVSEYRLSTGMMSENEAERYFGLMKRALSGTIGKNLIDIRFTTQQVAGKAPEHKLLMDLRETGLADEELRKAFYDKVTESLSLGTGYLILLGCESYDVPFKSKDGDTQADASGETYRYILCAVCPVKQTKAALHYVPESREFHDGGVTQTAAAPELGFLFPAFNNRSTNIYDALYYTHSTKESHQSFIDAVFNVSAPAPAAEQKRSFEALLTTALDEECSMEVVQTVHDQLRGCIEMHKEAKVAEPLLISKEQVKAALCESGVSEEKVAKFGIDYDSAFGFEAQLHPKNIIDDRRFEITTPDVTIRVAPDKSDLIETRVIGGVKYILIPADEAVEVNGVSIQIRDEKPDHPAES